MPQPCDASFDFGERSAATDCLYAALKGARRCTPAGARDLLAAAQGAMVAVWLEEPTP